MKDPAILWYPSDWISGTMGMTLEEKGAYMEVLMMQFSRGHMTSQMVGQLIGQKWDAVKHKFVQDENGLWYNERMDMEKEKRKRYVDTRKNNLKGFNQYTKNKGGHMGGRLTSHMENENEIENKSIIPPSIESVRRYCEIRNNGVDYNKWHNFYQSKGWKVGKEKMKDWQAAVRTWEDKKDQKDERKVAL